MKRALLSIAALGAAGGAFAQSSVTLFGIVDATAAWGRGSLANRVQLTNSGHSSSRLGFRGDEDLGGGLRASFWLEAGVGNDDGRGSGTNTNNQVSGASGGGGLTFNRRSTVSLAGNWGEVRLGRDYVPQFYAYSPFDAFSGLGAAIPVTYNLISGMPTSTRASNSIGYLLPSQLGGVYGQAMYYTGENPSNAGATEDDGKGYGFRIGYTSGPVNVALAHGRTNYASGDFTQQNLAGQVGIGKSFRLLGHLARTKLGAIESKGFDIGGIFYVGPGEIRAAYSTVETDAAGPADPKSSKIAVGYVHNLSKRTAIYTTYARIRNSGGAAMVVNGAGTAPNTSSSGLDIGLRHAF